MSDVLVIDTKTRSHSKMESSTNDLSESHLKLATKEIDPKRCKPWKFHNRDGAWLTKERCFDLINSIQKNGQIEHVLVRQIKDDPNYDYEIIYGVRRWFACSQIPNQKLLAKVTEADDKTCMILMHTENSDSKDISEFERAFSFAQQLRAGIFRNQTEMAKAMGITQGLISRMVKSAELFDYDWIRVLFQNKLEIKVKPAYKLICLLKDPSKEILIRAAANEFAMRLNKGEYISPKKILKKLIIAGLSESENLKKKEVIYSQGDEKIIYCKRDLQGKVIVVFENNARSLKKEDLLAALQTAVERFIVA